jgi:hypothetical protein
MKELTHNGRDELQRMSESILRKGINSEKLTKSEINLINKTKNHIERSHYTSNVTPEMLLVYCSKLYEDPKFEILSQQFVKDATKQSASEKAQLKCMEENGFKMVKMSASGKNSLRFDGKNEYLIPYKIEGVTSRSFDYSLKYSGITEFFLGKVVEGQGGHQNQVKSEIVNFLIRSNSYLVNNSESNLIFTALVDGGSLRKKDINEYKKYTSKKVRLMSCDNYKPYI